MRCLRFATLILSLAFASFGGARRANAALIFEPYGGYGVGHVDFKYKDTYSVTSLQGYTDSGSLSGVAYGARLGLYLRHFAILAAEYQGLSGKQKLDKSTTSTTANMGSVFATMGFQSPMGFRLLGSFGFTSTVDFPATSTATESKITGSAYKFLIGWMVPAGFALNLEYMLFAPKKYEQNGTSTDVADMFSKYNFSNTMVTLSFPLTFF